MTMHMTFLTESTGNTVPVFEEIRSTLDRPDLSDDVLRTALAEERFQPDGGLSAGDFAAGLGRPEQRAGLIRTLRVPPPAHGLDMPEHDLNPPAGVRLAPLLRRLRRALPEARPRLKRLPARIR